MHVYLHIPEETRGIGSPRTEFTYRPPDTGAGSQTWVVWKNRLPV